MQRERAKSESHTCTENPSIHVSVFVPTSAFRFTFQRLQISLPLPRFDSCLAAALTKIGIVIFEWEAISTSVL